MKYVVIDLETSGLDPETCQILEMAAVIDDLSKPNRPLEELPKFQTYVSHDFYQGDAYALSLNHQILKKLYIKDAEDSIIEPDGLMYKFFNFLLSNGYDHEEGNIGVVAAGKNFSNFDQKFLEKLPDQHFVYFHHRTLDPMMLFLKSSDWEPPSSKECMERAGIAGEVAHTALEDAMMVVKLIRAGMKNKCNV